jgi:hypothetical protein
MNSSRSALKDHLLYLSIAYPLYFLAYTAKYSLVHLQRCNADHSHIASYRPSPKLFAVSLFGGISTRHHCRSRVFLAIVSGPVKRCNAPSCSCRSTWSAGPYLKILRLRDELSEHALDLSISLATDRDETSEVNSEGRIRSSANPFSINHACIRYLTKLHTWSSLCVCHGSGRVPCSLAYVQDSPGSRPLIYGVI